MGANPAANEAANEATERVSLQGIHFSDALSRVELHRGPISAAAVGFIRPARTAPSRLREPRAALLA